MCFNSIAKITFYVKFVRNYNQNTIYFGLITNKKTTLKF